MTMPQAGEAPGAAAPASLAKSTTAGVIWGAGGALIYQALALFVQTTLTYLVSKAQYGTYGKAFAILTMTMLLQQAGFNEILLRRASRLRLWGTVAFWCAGFLGCCGSLLLLMLAYPLGLLYRDHALTVLLLMACPVPLVRSLLVLPTAELINRMRFRIHYGLMSLNAVATSLATLGFAWAGCAEKSFIAAILLIEPLYVLTLWRIAGSRVRGGPRFSRWLPLVKDLRFTFGSNTARWMRSSVDPLILGLFASQAVVGVYFFAQSMVVQIVRVITLNLSGVLLPALNKIADDPVRQTTAFLRASRAMLLIGAPFCVGLAAVAPLFVRVFLDVQKWSSLPPVLTALALGTVFRLLDEPAQALISAQGRFRLGFRMAVMTGSAYLLASAIGSWEGDALRMGAVVALYYGLVGPGVLAIAIRPGGGTYKDALRVFVVPLAIAVCSIFPWLLLDQHAPGQGRPRDAAVLACTILGSCLTYLGVCRIVQPPGWTELLNRVQDIAPSRLKAAIAAMSGEMPNARRVDAALHEESL
jgi:O-antigen/teichoic acid export membrane protein